MLSFCVFFSDKVLTTDWKSDIFLIFSFKMRRLGRLHLLQTIQQNLFVGGKM